MEWEGMRVRVRVRVRTLWVFWTWVFECDLCFDGHMEGWKEIEFKRLIFHKQLQWTQFRFKPNRVQRTQFLCTKTEFNELDFWAYVDTLFTSAAGKIGNSSTIYSIYNPKIESTGLELLETKYVWNIA